MATFWALAVAIPMVFGSMATSAGLGHALFRLQELKTRREDKCDRGKLEREWGTKMVPSSHGTSCFQSILRKKFMLESQYTTKTY